MTYLPNTPIKYVKTATSVSVAGFGTHLWDYLSNQDAEFCRRTTATYDNTPLKGLYFSNWFFNIGGFSALDMFHYVIFNTINETVSRDSYTGASLYKNLYVSSMTQNTNTIPHWHNVIALGTPKFAINSSLSEYKGAPRNTGRELNSHIFMLPIAENK